MEFEIEIKHYLQSVNYTKWSIVGILNYLSGDLNFSSESSQNIKDQITKELHVIANDTYCFQAVRNKAIQVLIKI
jgi:hypothetical protein